jgi:nucleoid DNA-binding protein
MNKKDLITEVCYKTKLTKKEIDIVLTSVLDLIVTKVSQGKELDLLALDPFTS